MTVAALPATVTYIEDGSSVSFPVPFRFKAASDLIVERLLAVGGVQTLTIGTDYTVTGGATDAGGTLVRNLAANGARLRIRRQTARAQPMTYTTGDRFPATSHEDAIDRGILISQEQDAEAEDLRGRALMVPAGETVVDLPPIASRIGGVKKIVGVDRLTGAIGVEEIDDSYRGPPGGDGNSYPDLPSMRAAEITGLTYWLRTSKGPIGYAYAPGNFTGLADDVYVVALDNVPLSTGALVRQTADNLAHQYPEAGSRPRRWAETGVKQVELSGFTGADPTGGSDSYAALQTAIGVALRRKGELIIDSSYRISMNGRPPIKPTAPLTIRGDQSRSSNIPDSNQHKAALYFDKDARESIVVDNTQLTIDRCAIIGPARVSTFPGIKTVGEGSALRLCGGAVVQSWQIGVQYLSGYYHRINDATFADCITGLQVSAPGGAIPPIYNLQAHQLKVTAPGRDVPNTTCMSIFGGSQVSVSQSSFESFTGNGIVIQDASLDLFSSYFEGFGGWNVFLSRYGHVVAIGNRVYLNEGANRFISVEGGSTPGAHVVARGNQFVTPSNSDPAIVYSLRSDDPEAVSDIDGGVLLNTPGPNVQHLTASFFAGMGPAALRGNHNIRFPFGHARANRPVSTMPVSIAPAQSGMANPDEGMLLPFALNGFPGDDPSALRSQWGDHPMMMAFHRSSEVPAGQWEKVGLLLPYRAPPADAAGVAAWINQFVTDLRKQGVMRNP